MATVLEEEGPYTLFAPTNIAFTFLKPGYLDFLTSEEVQCKITTVSFFLNMFSVAFSVCILYTVTYASLYIFFSFLPI